MPADFRVALFDGSNREETIYRSKAVGEPPLMLAISVFAAIADAIHSLHPGKPVALDAPATPEAILKAVGPVDAVAALAPLSNRVERSIRLGNRREDGEGLGPHPGNDRAARQRRPGQRDWTPPDRCRARPARASSCSRTAGFFGSIGGGRLEYEAIAAARAALAAGRGKAEFRDWPLGPNLGQCCGGMVKTLTETFDASDLATVRRFEEAEKSGAFVTVSPSARTDGSRACSRRTSRSANRIGRRDRVRRRRSFHEQFGEVTKPVLLFGAGHVGRAVVLALAPLPFTVRWIDSRPDQFPQYVPQNVVTVCTDAADRELAEAPRDAMIIVMTHSHALDFDITAAALQRETFDFVGLIGSETKRARFVSCARQMGVADEPDRASGLSDRHSADQRQRARRDCRRARRATPHRARTSLGAAAEPGHPAGLSAPDCSPAGRGRRS